MGLETINLSGFWCLIFYNHKWIGLISESLGRDLSEFLGP